MGIIVIVLNVWTKKRRITLMVIGAALLIFDSCMGVAIYYDTHVIAKQKANESAELAKLDIKIAAIKTKKAAEKKLADKTAKQKAAADAALPSQQQGQIVTPAGCAIKGPHGDPNLIDVVVNKKHCLNPIDYTPSDLVTVYGATISAKASAAFVSMYQAASAAGVPLSVTSSFRSYSNQVVTYNNWVTVNGSTASADTVSARPGYSEHQTGFAVDLSAGGCSLECFLNSAQYTWLQANAANYGWIQRYPVGLEATTGYSSEAWHYRYVGTAVAKDMKAKGIKTLEQLWNISGGGY